VVVRSPEEKDGKELFEIDSRSREQYCTSRTISIGKSKVFSGDRIIMRNEDLHCSLHIGHWPTFSAAAVKSHQKSSRLKSWKCTLKAGPLTDASQQVMFLVGKEFTLHYHAGGNADRS